MFCPEGYLTLDGTCFALRNLSEKWWAEVGETLQEKDYRERVLCGKSKFTKGPFPNPAFRAEVAKAAYMKWLAYRFARRNWERFFICSPDGQTLRIGPEFLRPYEDLDGPFPNRIDHQDIIAHDFSIFLHIRYPYGLVAPCDDENYIQANRLEGEFADLKPFTGWALCWKPKVFEHWKQEVQEILLEPTEAGGMPSKILSPRGRPKTGDGIVERAVQKEFSKRKREGRLQLDQPKTIWLDVELWAQEVLDVDVSRSSAQRWLAEILKE